MRTTPPNPDQLEITLFGPGYGECVLVHLGENRWIVVDSCIDAVSTKPVVLEYFRAIGISPKDAVLLIVVSHWHDDHVRGLSDLVESCPNTPVCISSALTKKEFLSVLIHYDQISIRADSTGVSEIKKTYEILQRRSAQSIRAIANRTILSLPHGRTGNSCKITALSPSDRAYDLFLQGIAGMIPKAPQTQRRAPSLSPNQASIAL